MVFYHAGFHRLVESFAIVFNPTQKSLLMHIAFTEITMLTISIHIFVQFITKVSAIKQYHSLSRCYTSGYTMTHLQYLTTELWRIQAHIKQTDSCGNISKQGNFGDEGVNQSAWTVYSRLSGILQRLGQKSSWIRAVLSRSSSVACWTWTVRRQTNDDSSSSSENAL